MDKRVIKTKRAIHEAMTKLINEKPIEEITVTELADAAEINRKTLYNYYGSVYMVAEEMEDEIIARFEETLRKIDFDTLLMNPQTTFITLAKLITSDLDFYGNILTNRNQLFFLQKIIASLKQRIMTLYADGICAGLYCGRPCICLPEVVHERKKNGYRIPVPKCEHAGSLWNKNAHGIPGERKK